MMKAIVILLGLLVAAPVLGAPAKEQQAKKAVEGTIHSLRGKVLTITITGDGELPAAGAACTVLKHFVKNLGFLKTSGWLEIAEAKVKTSGKRLLLTVVKKKSKMKVNGKPVNHFKRGTRAKVTWTP